MPRFFVPEAPPAGTVLPITGPILEHIRVLRLKPGNELILCDGRGTDCRCTIESIDPLSAAVRVSQTGPSSSEPSLRCSVYMAYAKQDKLEHVVQKATELGAHEIVAYPSARCVSRPDPASLEKKLARWQKIAVSAAEQSGRGRVPQVRALKSYEEALLRAAKADLAVLLYENEDKLSFRSAVSLAPFQTASLVSGPEGGFDPSEVAFARSCGLHICSLGRRILRCETAPLCALSALLYAAGELE